MTRNYLRNPLRIFIAAGHGGNDPGAVHNSVREADINLTIAMLMEQDLRRHGVQVKLSRTADEPDKLAEQIAECNAYAPDFAVAIHTNSSVNGNASGFEVYYQQTSWANQQYSHRMAQLFDTNVARYLNVTTRGLKTNKELGWLNRVEAPCILVENFFINGPRAQWYLAPEQLNKFAKCYVRAILEFYSISYRSDVAQSVHYKLYHNENEQKDCVCPGFLLNGHYYVQLREYEKHRDGYQLSYDVASGIPIVYNPAYYTESPYGDGLLPLSSFATEAERIMAGIEGLDSKETDSLDDYNFDEYDYTDSGELYKTNSLMH